MVLSLRRRDGGFLFACPYSQFFLVSDARLKEIHDCVRQTIGIRIGDGITTKPG